MQVNLLGLAPVSVILEPSLKCSKLENESLFPSRLSVERLGGQLQICFLNHCLLVSKINNIQLIPIALKLTI